MDDIAFDVREGEMHAICGENGAGKSTLIKLLTGAIPPTSGSFTFDGTEYTEMTPIKSRDIGIVAIYQEFTLIPYLTVAENVFLGREPTKGVVRDVRKINKETQELFEAFGVSISSKTKVDELGIAEQQIVEILKAVSQRAKLFIMDEPTAPLTINETNTFFNIVRKLKDEGATIIFISHRLEEVFELCDRVTVLCDGKYIVTKNIEEVNRKQLISYMVGRELAENYPAPTTSSKEVALSAKHLNNGKLKDVSFHLNRGEILGLGGLIGAGRTELAKALFGADRLESGDIELDGREYRPSTPVAGLKAGIGLIPEDRKRQGIVMDMTIRKNICISVLREISKGRPWVAAKEEQAYSSKYIKELSIKTPSDTQLVKNLSGGNQQKVVLAKMMAVDCDILIFDEPTRGIDVGAKHEIYLLMREIASQGKSIIMISSDMPELIGMSDRMYIMSNGYMVAELARAEYSQETILEYASSKYTMKEDANAQ